MKSFEEYLEEGIVKMQSPDPSRAQSLLQEAEESYSVLQTFLEAVGLSDRNANTVIKNVYDIIMELLRSKMLEKGYNSSGQGAHAAEVAYLRKLGLPEKDVAFADKLRYYRNGIIYYGKSFDADYAKKVLDFLENVRDRCS